MQIDPAAAVTLLILIIGLIAPAALIVSIDETISRRRREYIRRKLRK